MEQKNGPLCAGSAHHHPACVTRSTVRCSLSSRLRGPHTASVAGWSLSSSVNYCLARRCSSGPRNLLCKVLQKYSSFVHSVFAPFTLARRSTVVHALRVRQFHQFLHHFPLCRPDLHLKSFTFTDSLARTISTTTNSLAGPPFSDRKGLVRPDIFKLTSQSMTPSEPSTGSLTLDPRALPREDQYISSS